MLRQRRWIWALMMTWMCCACSTLLAGTAMAVQAQDAETISFPEAKRLANEEYIPSARSAMERKGDMELAALWDKATAGQPFLQYQLVGSELVGYEIVPRYVLVPVDHDGQLVGLIGIDPQTGAFGWRWDHLASTAEVPVPPEAGHLSALVERSGAKSTERTHDRKLIHVEGKNYWYIPTEADDISEHLFLPIGEEKPYRLEELELGAEPPGFMVAPDPLPSSPIRRLERLPAASERPTATGETATTGAVTWMVNAVPYYKQDCSLWC